MSKVKTNPQKAITVMENGKKATKGDDSYCHEYVGWPPISLEMSKNGNYNL